MAIQRTLSIIKPDAVAKNVIGDIVRRFEENGLSVIAMRMLHLTAKEAGRFYAVHKDRPFYKDLCTFMSSGPVLVMVLEGKNAVNLNRQLMGATNPKEAEAGTIRADHADSIDANAVHGSDSEENAAIELAFFFGDVDLHSRL
ncbi:MAG: nucleoside-diphosphate kinase [Mariprofundaceae bacterium]